MGETPDDSPCELDLSEAGVVAEIGRIVSSSIEIDEVYELFAEQVAILVPFDGIDIGTYDPKKDTITNVYAGGIEGVPAIPTGEATPLTGALTEEAIRSREARIYCAASEQALLAETPTPPVGMTFGLRSSLVVPLLARGSVFGVLTLRSSQSNAYSERHRRLAERLAGQIGGGQLRRPGLSRHCASRRRRGMPLLKRRLWPSLRSIAGAAFDRGIPRPNACSAGQNANLSGTRHPVFRRIAARRCGSDCSVWGAAKRLTGSRRFGSAKTAQASMS